MTGRGEVVLGRRGSIHRDRGFTGGYMSVWIGVPIRFLILSYRDY